ncbi:MAG: class E sortase [Actinomycetota bacterium]
MAMRPRHRRGVVTPYRESVTAFQLGIRAIGELLITAGLVLLLFVVWQLWWTTYTSNQAQQETTQELEREWTEPKPAARPLKTIPMGEAFALIRVPRWGRNYVRPILRGVELDVLKNGIGHYPDTAGPGEVGNFSIAGHRRTHGEPFNRVDELRVGDPIVVETRNTWYVYRVTDYKIVNPSAVDVILPVPERPEATPRERLMTLTTCHPEFSSRQRYIVFTELDETMSRTQDGPVPAVLS